MVADQEFKRYRAYWSQFIEGLTQPSLPALIGTVGVATSVFCWCVIFITPTFIATTGYGYFINGATDEYGYLTSEVLRIKQTPAQQLSIALVGESSLREAISDVTQLNHWVEEKIGQPVVSYDLMAGSLSHWEAVCILDNLNENFRGIVVLYISPNALARKNDYLAELVRYPRLALDCPSFDAEVRLAGLTVPKRFNNYFLSHYSFFIARQSALLNLITGQVQLERHKIARWESVMNQQRWQLAIQQVKQWLEGENYHYNRQANLGVYARLIQRLQQSKQIQVALVESVRNPKVESIIYATPAAKQLYDEYQIDVKKFVHKNNVFYWNIGKRVNLQPEDFVDHTHLKDHQSRQRYTLALAELLAERFIQIQ